MDEQQSEQGTENTSESAQNNPSPKDDTALGKEAGYSEVVPPAPASTKDAPRPAVQTRSGEGDPPLPPPKDDTSNNKEAYSFRLPKQK